MMAMMMTGPNEFTAIRVDRHKRNIYIDKAAEEDKTVQAIIDINNNKKIFEKNRKIKNKEKYLKRCRNRAVLYMKRKHKYGKF